MVATPSHHRQLGVGEFSRLATRKGGSCLELAEDQKRKMGGSTYRYLRHKRAKAKAQNPRLS
jgi:hypothetical protein